tara:strand:+ start:221 stop:994 length:774 start_codon:yes stop_codon:yes gene_type:complete
MKNNLISILITNYNKEHFLKRCLDSVSKQNFKNYEIIMFDDCSNDGSLKIAEKYRKIKIIRNKKRSNKSPPLNQINGLIKAFKQSKGEIICLLDGDDCFKKNKLKKIFNFFYKNQNQNTLYDIPQIKSSNFIIKQKMSSTIWPTIFPTSCISVRKKFFKIFLNNIYKNNFFNLEVDARLVIFSKFYMNEYNILDEKLTDYNFDPNGITAKISKFSKKWWLRRSEAFSYLKNVKKMKNEPLNLSFDFMITKFVVFFIN